MCHDGIKVMAHLAKNQANQSLCIRLAQIFLVQDWIKPDRNCCTQVRPKKKVCVFQVA